MNKELILLKLNSLEDRIKKISVEYGSLKIKNQEYANENRDLKSALERRNEELKNFQNQHKISKIVSSIAEDGNKSNELRLKINEYIREIDKCIAHLSE